MSLATRCTHCGTVFRVVQDQLKVSEGWVRCGRCNEVFNAVEGLFDLDRESPPDWSPSDPVHAQALEAVAQDSSTVETAPGAFSAAASEPLGWDAPPPAPPARPRVSVPDEDDAPVPEFVRQAASRADWERSPRRAGLAVLVLLLATLLAGQWVHHFRDLVAARWPAAGTALAAWCAQVGCTLAPLRRIEAITVEGSALARAAAADAFRLNVTLRNRDSLSLALPWIDLTLTDGSGALVARRALKPEDFRVAATPLAPGAEQNLQLLLSAGSAKVSGYTVEIFYP